MIDLLFYLFFTIKKLTINKNEAVLTFCRCQECMLGLLACLK